MPDFEAGRYAYRHRDRIATSLQAVLTLLPELPLDADPADGSCVVTLTVVAPLTEPEEMTRYAKCSDASFALANLPIPPEAARGCATTVIP